MKLNKLTELEIKRAKPRAADYLLGDGGGLFVRVKPNGTKSWVFIYSTARRRRWKGLGVYPELGLSSAREVAAGYRKQAAQGIDPTEAEIATIEAQKAERLRLSRKPTVKHLFTIWQERELKSRRKDQGLSVLQAFERDVYPSYGNRLAHEIERKDILQIMTNISSRGARRSANVVRAELKQMFDFAVDQELIEHDPTARVKKLKGAERIRERILSQEEIRELNEKLPAAALSETYRLAIWIMLSTCCRVGELSRSEWRNVNIDARKWTIPADNSKNGREHVIQLSNFAIQKFLALRALSHQAWLYPNRDGSGPVGRQSIQKAIKDRQRISTIRGRSTRSGSLLLAAGEWTVHDLRRTGATIMGNNGVRPDVIDRCLNHVEPNRVTRTYQRQELLEERRAAFDALGTFLAHHLSARSRDARKI